MNAVKTLFGGGCLIPERISATILLASVLSILGAGCHRAFPESAVYRAIGGKKIFSDKGQPPPLASYSESVDTELLMKECKFVTNFANADRSSFISGAMAACSNTILTLGGEVHGHSSSGNKEIGFWSENRELFYGTSKTSGRIMLYVTALDDSRRYVIFIIFENKRSLSI